ncbi:MAG: hypothetical protein COS28_02230 [Nitrospirae bacterium CG02_land_8_20_14_3_00_44_33]|nr:redoxin domain-containing protein [Nitrospirota bacterium]PIV43342.1 MAG: hypothetical protein COS28_02230 [Nitrospirae bacterium CG02_land_8_20_14_3_00_44_33]PIV67080.1 MAG: hypothetical protein COS10_02955 [Nitrospirae bacterium CG01_land_8_20_14_3_00_44_22]PIW89637.1 MAG: hypothetical protein COZ93_03965 [Nitrospirae bacterium CG_4_8_14_3_um_filter_44_28]
MKKILMMIVFLSLIFPVYGFALDINDNAPDFRGVALDGKQVAYSELKGKKPVYLMFWATW